MHELSICLPTHNRSVHLANCLNSIAWNNLGALPSVQLCISDSGSTDETDHVVNVAGKTLPIKYQRHASNLGFTKNFLKVIEMAEGEFVWVIGDDDPLMLGASQDVLSLPKLPLDVDYFHANSCPLAAEYVFRFPQPFDLSI